MFVHREPLSFITNSIYNIIWYAGRVLLNKGISINIICMHNKVRAWLRGMEVMSLFELFALIRYHVKRNFCRRIASPGSNNMKIWYGIRWGKYSVITNEDGRWLRKQLLNHTKIAVPLKLVAISILCVCRKIPFSAGFKIKLWESVTWGKKMFLLNYSIYLYE